MPCGRFEVPESASLHLPSQGKNIFLQAFVGQYEESMYLCGIKSLKPKQLVTIPIMKYESCISKTTSSAKSVYAVVSDLKNLERVRDKIPQDKVQELDIEPDCIRIKVDGLGQKLSVRILDKEENKVVKYGVEDSPVSVFFWIQMKEVAPGDTRLKLTLEADIPFMFRMMLEKKLQQGLDQAAEMMAQFPYEAWEKGDTV